MKLYHRQHEKFHFNFCENWIAKLLFVVRSVGRLVDVCSVLMLFCSLLSMLCLTLVYVWPEFLLEYMRHASLSPFMVSLPQFQPIRYSVFFWLLFNFISRMHFVYCWAMETGYDAYETIELWSP